MLRYARGCLCQVQQAATGAALSGADRVSAGFSSRVDRALGRLSAPGCRCAALPPGSGIQVRLVIEDDGLFVQYACSGLYVKNGDGTLGAQDGKYPALRG